MKLTLGVHSALAALRALRRAGVDVQALPKGEIVAPQRDGRRWPKYAPVVSLAVLTGGNLAHRGSLCVAVPCAAARLRARWAENVVHAKGVPAGSALQVEEGVWMVCPELLFVELAQVMEPAYHLLLGFELTGSFSRDPRDPRTGRVAYNLRPATSVRRIEGYLDQCSGVWGSTRARETLALLSDNAWSPMEAVLATMASLPTAELGYEMGPVVLNPRHATMMPEGAEATKSSRVPDMLFMGSDVGLNYEGEEHLDLGAIVNAAKELALNPGVAVADDALARAVSAVRTKLVDDQRRDLELGAAGMQVFRATKEDLFERGATDRMMGQVLKALERRGEHDVSRQLRALRSRTLARARQELLWSMLPGELGRKARIARAERLSRQASRTPTLVSDELVLF